jgi:hypothetical protein
VIKRKRPLGFASAEWALSIHFAWGLVAKDYSEKRTDAAGANTLTVPLLPVTTAIRVIVLILPASFHLVAAIAPVEVISSVIVPSKIRRLVIATPVTPLRGNRQSHRAYQHQSH